MASQIALKSSTNNTGTVTFTGSSDKTYDIAQAGLTLMTAQTASGTFVDFTGIPSWAKRITVMFNGISTNGASVPIIRLGATTIQTTGYLTTSGAMIGGGTQSATQTDGFYLGLTTTTASNVFYGKMELVTMGSNVWVQDNQLSYPGISNQLGQGLVTLSGTLDRIRLTTVNGTDTFDAGTINVMYEG